MEPQQQITLSGQELQAGDFNNVASEASHVDDYVLAELLRLAPEQGSNVVTRGVLSFGTDGTAQGSSFDSSMNAVVRATLSADGSVFIFPFRAVVGPRVDQTTAISLPTLPNPQLNALRDVRSAIYCPNNTSGFGFPKLALASNASGNPRWDLICALVSVDVNGVSTTRFVKPPSPSGASGVATSVIPQLITTVSIAVVNGTAAASPVFPAIPADTIGTSYYIPLAYVRVPNGFGGSATVAVTDICDATPALGLYSSARAMPANGQFKAGGVVIPTAVQQSWGATGTRPTAYAPPAIGMGPTRFILLDLLSASSANWSHQNGSVVDNSTDWTLRWFKTIAYSNNVGKFSSEHPPPALPTPGSGADCPSDMTSGLSGTPVQLGHSMAANGAGVCGYWTPSMLTMNSGAIVRLTVDTSGRLIVGITGTPLCKLFVWLESSQPFSMR